MVQPAHPGLRERAAGGMHRGRPRAERVRRSGDISPAIHPWEPPMRPGTPNPSIPGESFMDTQLVNGTAYPYVEVPAGPVRFRVLNANNDRVLNLQLYKACGQDELPISAPALRTPSTRNHCLQRDLDRLHRGQDGPGEREPGEPVRGHAERDSRSGNGRTGMDPDRHRRRLHAEAGCGAPAADRLQHGPGHFNFGIVNQHSLFLRSAERADVMVDFSGYGRKDPYSLQRFPGACPGRCGALRLLHGERRTRWMPAARPPRSPATAPTPGRSCRSGSATATTADAPDYSLANLKAVFAEDRHEARCLRGIPGPDHHTAGGLQLRLQRLVPDGCVPVHPQRRRLQQDLPTRCSTAGGTWSQSLTPVTLPFETEGNA